MPLFDANNAAIYYEIHGDGKPLILLHGYALNSIMWELQVPVLSKKHRVITIDLRGFGRSSCANEWSGSAMASDVTGLIKSLNLTDVAILGFSMSGPVAFRVALEMPDNVSRLIMVSSILPSAGRPKTEKEIKAQNEELEILKSQGPEGWAEEMGIWEGPLMGAIFKKNPGAKSIWERMFVAHNPDYLACMMKARLNTQSNVNWRARLSEAKQKTLIVMGEQDKRFIDGAYHLAKAIPEAKLEIIKDAGHMVNLEKPEEFNKTILNFLN